MAGRRSALKGQNHRLWEKKRWHTGGSKKKPGSPGGVSGEKFSPPPGNFFPRHKKKKKPPEGFSFRLGFQKFFFNLKGGGGGKAYCWGLGRGQGLNLGLKAFSKTPPKPNVFPFDFVFFWKIRPSFPSFFLFLKGQAFNPPPGHLNPKKTFDFKRLYFPLLKFFFFFNQPFPKFRAFALEKRFFFFAFFPLFKKRPFFSFWAGVGPGRAGPFIKTFWFFFFLLGGPKGGVFFR